MARIHRIYMALIGAVTVIAILNVIIPQNNLKSSQRLNSSNTLIFAKKKKNFTFFTSLSLPLDKGIYFVETSGRNYLYARELCALESAAQNNPSRPIYYILTSLDFSQRGNLRTLQLKYSNIHILQIELTSFFLNTPFQSLWMNNKIQESKYSVSHLSDVMRFLILYTFGGTYLDSDLIVLRPLPTQYNYAGVEHIKDPFYVAVGVLHFYKGHPILRQAISRLMDHFDGVTWNQNGPVLLTNSIKAVCNADSMEGINESNCLGLRLLSPERVYPVYFRKWKTFFNASLNKVVEEELKDSLVAHYWGKMSFGVPFFENTTLFQMAKRHCPNIAHSLLS